MKTRTKIIVAGIAVALVAGTTVKLMSNKRIVAENVYRLDPDKKVLIHADTALFKSLDRIFSYTGTFAPFREVMIIPQVPGEVTHVFFNEGDVVAQGKRLVQIDDELLQAQYASAESNYLTAKRNLERYENASTGGGVSPLQLDNYRLNFKSAESELKQLSKQIRLSKLEAPFAGTITFKDVEKGSVVGSSPVARVTDLSQLKLEISVPEKEVRMFREGSSIALTTDVYPDKVFNGKVEYVAERADNAHNYSVKVLLKNNSSVPLKAGMYATALLNTHVANSSIVISRSALLGSAKNPQVFVVKGDTVTLKSIQTGASNGNSVEVVSGLEEGELVVTTGQINLTEGSKVEVVK